MLLVDLNRDTLAVVPDRDQVAIRVNLDLYHGHAWVPLEVVGRIYKYLIYRQVDQLLVSAKIEFATINGFFEGSERLTEDFVETWDVLDLSEVKLLRCLVEHPKLLSIVFYTADVSVWSEQNVL